MDGCNGPGTRINSFALVSYLRDPLAGFLDGLRRELVPEYAARAHVTVLPPRPLMCPSDRAWAELQSNLQDFPPFEVKLGDVKVFPVTEAIYLSVDLGQVELERMHALLNAHCLAYKEPFLYHPHVTLAQELPAERRAECFETASQRWKEFPHARTFTVDNLTFVQNTLENRWTDLAGMPLANGVHV